MTILLHIDLHIMPLGIAELCYPDICISVLETMSKCGIAKLTLKHGKLSMRPGNSVSYPEMMLSPVRPAHTAIVAYRPRVLVELRIPWRNTWFFMSTISPVAGPLQLAPRTLTHYRNNARLSKIRCSGTKTALEYKSGGPRVDLSW